MRSHHLLAIVGALLVGFCQSVLGQDSPGKREIDLAPPPATPALFAPPDSAEAENQKKIDGLVQEVKNLQSKQVALQGSAKPDVKEQLKLLEEQIETQQKMIQLLVEQVKKQPALLEAQGRRSAQRDQELAQAVDTVVEHQDSLERYGPGLPAPLKELFLPGGNNETPLTITGALSVGFSKILGDSSAPILSDGTLAPNGPRNPTPRSFYFGEFTPDFLLKLDDWVLLEAEIGINSNGSVSAGSFAQADFFVNDWLTIIAGRFVAPIGWYNERTNNPWINPLPGDAPGGAPLLWLQVLPATALMGVQAAGAFYLGCSPFKLEYNAYISNGLNVTPGTAGAPTIDELANLEGMESTFASISNEMAFGGRIGLWWPEAGIEAGISGMVNGDYVAGGFEESLALMALDLNYRMCDWTARFEYGITRQQTQSFNAIPTPGLLADDIVRQGVNALVSYRPREACNRWLRNLEMTYRFGWVNFSGIDPTALNLNGASGVPSPYGTPLDIPVSRQQHEIGLAYYFYPRLALKTAYQINIEPGFELHDNQFIAELSWGW